MKSRKEIIQSAKSLSTGSLLASLGMLSLFFMVAYVKPIPLWGGQTFTFVDPSIQILLRTILYLVIFISLQAGFIALYVWLFKQGIKGYKNFHKIPDKIDQFMRTIVQH